MEEFLLILMKSEKTGLFVYRCLSFCQYTQMTVCSFWFPSGHAACICVQKAAVISHLPGQKHCTLNIGTLQSVFAGEPFVSMLGGWWDHHSQYIINNI